jgi:hypothetical protein
MNYAKFGMLGHEQDGPHTHEDAMVDSASSGRKVEGHHVTSTQPSTGIYTIQIRPYMLYKYCSMIISTPLALLG